MISKWTLVMCACALLLLASSSCAPPAKEQPLPTTLLIQHEAGEGATETAQETDAEEEASDIEKATSDIEEEIESGVAATPAPGVEDMPQSESLPEAGEEPATEAVEISQAKETFLGLLKKKDSEGLLQLLASTDPEYYVDYLNLTMKDMDTILRLLEFDVELDSLELVVIESTPTRALYQAIGKKGGVEVILSDHLYIEKNNEAISYGWSYIRYFPYIEWLANEYVKQVQLGDPEALASVMSVDDLIYSKQNAESIIYNYKSVFEDMNDLKVLYNGAFEFLVIGGKGKHHSFKVVYGDGLIGIQDTFAPQQQ